MSKSKQIVSIFWKQDIQKRLNSPLGPLPSLLLWDGNKCYLAKKKGEFQFSHTSTLGMKKNPDTRFGSKWNPLPGHQAVCQRRLLVLWSIDEDVGNHGQKTQLKSSPRVTWWLCPPGGWGTGDNGALAQHTPWHLPRLVTSLPPSFCPGAGLSWLLGSVYTSLWTQSPSVYLHSQK